MKSLFLAEIIPVPRVTTVDWVLIPIVLMIIITAYLKTREEAVLRYLFTSYFNFSIVKASREEKRTNTKATLLLITNAFLGLAIWIYIVNLHLEAFVSSVGLLFSVLIFLVVWFLLKRMMMSIVGFITETRDVFAEARSYNLYYYQILGVIIIPGLVVGLLVPFDLFNSTNMFFRLFSNIGLFYCFLATSIMYVIKLIHGLRQSKGLKISWYYIILYLCTLEILPLVVLYGMLIGNISMFN